jgi:hypothetical protein
MSALTINLVVEQNSDFEATFTVTDEDTGSPINLTYYTVASTIKKSFYSSTSISFITSIIDAPNGKLRLVLSKSVASSMRGGRYVYDIVITNTISNIHTRVVEGIVTVKEGVT